MSKGLRGKGREKAEVEVQELEEVQEVQEVEVQEVEVDTKPQKSQPMVRVLPNADLRTYIGDQWYSFKKGTQTNVPQQVKDVLAKAGLLTAL